MEDTHPVFYYRERKDVEDTHPVYYYRERKDVEDTHPVYYYRDKKMWRIHIPYIIIEIKRCGGCNLTENLRDI